MADAADAAEAADAADVAEAIVARKEILAEEVAKYSDTWVNFLEKPLSEQMIITTSLLRKGWLLIDSQEDLNLAMRHAKMRLIDLCQDNILGRVHKDQVDQVQLAYFATTGTPIKDAWRDAPGFVRVEIMDDQITRVCTYTRG